MTKYSILALFSFLSVSAMAQTQKYEFCPQGAKWVYQYVDDQSWPRNSFNIYQYEEDSVIDGQLVKIIKEDLMYSSGSSDPQDPLWEIPDLNHPDNTFIRNHFVYQSDDSSRVYFYDKGEFRPLYDFSLEEGDLFVVYNYDYHLCEPVDSVYAVVEDFSTGSINPGFIQFSSIYTTLNQNYFYPPTRIVNFLGSTSKGMFPMYYYEANPNCPTTIYEDNEFIPYGGISCYSDDSGIGRNPWQRTNCQDIFNVVLSSESFKPLLNSSKLTVYPNPSSDFFHIDYTKRINSVWLVDLLGKITPLEKNIHKEYNVRHINKGMYLLKVESESTIYTAKIILH